MKYLTLLLLVLLFVGCSAPQEPIFKGFRNIKTTTVSTKKITVTGNAVFQNPNTLGGEVVATNIEVMVNDISAGIIAQDLAIPVPASLEFAIPLTFNIAPRDLYENDRNGTLGGIINAVFNKKVDLHYLGTVQMKIAGFPHTLEVDHEEEVKF